MEDHSLKVKVSMLYYRQNLSKVEIGKNLRISRFRVAKLIEEALKEGIVTIDIKEPENTFTELENTLESRFEIFRACIVESVSDYGLIKKNIGRAAAKCVTDLVYDGDTIGIAWGTTIYEMVNALPQRIDKKNISVVQLTGGLNQIEMKYSAIELSSRLCRIFNSHCYQLFVPAIVDGIETKKVLFNDSHIKRTLDMFDEVDIAIVGIGSVTPKPSTLLYKEGILKEEYVKYLHTHCAVGDINSCFFDADGNNCFPEFEERALGMSVEQLKKVRYVVGVAGGEFKVNAIRAALKGGIINILVTDHRTAEALVDT